MKIKGTILDLILERNHDRQELFFKMKIIPDQLILKLDFNYNTLIERGIQLNALKSVKYFLEFIKRNEKSS